MPIIKRRPPAGTHLVSRAVIIVNGLTKSNLDNVGPLSIQYLLERQLCLITLAVELLISNADYDVGCGDTVPGGNPLFELGNSHHEVSPKLESVEPTWAIAQHYVCDLKVPTSRPWRRPQYSLLQAISKHCVLLWGKVESPTSRGRFLFGLGSHPAGDHNTNVSTLQTGTILLGLMCVVVRFLE